MKAHIAVDATKASGKAKVEELVLSAQQLRVKDSVTAIYGDLIRSWHGPLEWVGARAKRRVYVESIQTRCLPARPLLR